MDMYRPTQVPVKIAHISTVDTSLHHLLLNQLLSIQRAGYTVVGISSPGPEVSVLTEAGIRHIPVLMTRNVTPVADVIALWQLYRIMRRERFSIVHTHTPKAGLLGQLAAKIAGVPVIINTVHGFYFHDQMSRIVRQFYISLEKLAAYCSDSIFSQNREDIQTAISESICTPDKIKYLGNGIDIQQFDPGRYSKTEVSAYLAQFGLSQDVPVVGFVGRLAGQRKGFLDFLKAGQRIAALLPNVVFLIIGTADLGKPDAVEPSAADEYGIANHCLFLGHQPNFKLPILYQLMNVLVLPSLFEGFPRVVMEAAAMKVPSVVTDVKGNREAVRHNHNGLIVPLGDVEALAGAIMEILTDDDKAQQMGETGRRMAIEQFDEQLVFERVKTEYAQLLHDKGFRPPCSRDMGNLL